MGKRTSELLDVFRSESGASRSSKGRGRRGRSKGHRSGRSGASSSSFEGIFINRNQVLLAACVGLLLLLLSFTVGLGFGRRGARAASGGPELNRSTRAAPEKSQAWYVQGKMPKEDPLRLENIDPLALITDLARLYGLPRDHIWVEQAAGDLYHLYVGPFISKSDAESYVERHDLRVVGVRGARPFRFAKMVQRPRR